MSDELVSSSRRNASLTLVNGPSVCGGEGAGAAEAADPVGLPAEAELHHAAELLLLLLLRRRQLPPAGAARPANSSSLPANSLSLNSTALFMHITY